MASNAGVGGPPDAAGDAVSPLYPPTPTDDTLKRRPRTLDLTSGVAPRYRTAAPFVFDFVCSHFKSAPAVDATSRVRMIASERMGRDLGRGAVKGAVRPDG